MHMFSRRALVLALGSLTLLPVHGVAQEQPIKIIFPFSAGGSGDAVARLVAEHLQKKLGRAVIVDNRVGAGGRIAAQAVKDGPADGSMLLFAASSQFTLQPHIVSSLGYDPVADFVPISQVVAFEQALAISRQVPATTVKELAAWLKANPDKGTYGSPGAGTVPHFAGMEFARLEGLDLRHVAYRGTPVALPDLLTGRISMYIASTAELIEHHKSGGIRIVATAGLTRSAQLIDVPTLKEGGVDVEASSWFGFYGPARLASGVVAQLQSDIMAAVRTSEIRARILAMGFQPTGTTSDELKAIQREQLEQWGRIVKMSGYKTQQ